MSEEKSEPFVIFDPARGEPHSLEQAVQLAVGAASVCWESLEGTGQFLSDRASEIGEQLITWLRGVITNDAIDQNLLHQYRLAIDKNRQSILELEAENDGLKNQLKGRDEVIDLFRQEVEDLHHAMVSVDSSWTPPRQSPPQLAEMLQLVVDEYLRAKVKHGEKTMDGPGYTSEQRLAILVEEGGEVSWEVFNAGLQAAIGGVGHVLTYDQQIDQSARLLKELVQVAAMAATWGSVLVPGSADAGADAGAQPAPEALEGSGSGEGPDPVVEGALEAAGAPSVHGPLSPAQVGEPWLKGFDELWEERPAIKIRPQLTRVEAGATIRVPDGYVALLVSRAEMEDD